MSWVAGGWDARDAVGSRAVGPCSGAGAGLPGWGSVVAAAAGAVPGAAGERIAPDGRELKPHRALTLD